MRFFTLAFALMSATAISAFPSSPETGVSFTFDSPSIHPNATLEERTGGGGSGGKEHCKKERGRRPDTCGCYSGLDCHDSKSQCECGDQGNAKFEYCGSCQDDEPKCVCKGDNQSESFSFSRLLFRISSSGINQVRIIVLTRYTEYDKNQRKCVCKVSPSLPSTP